jgi:hypothetical protein
MPFGRESFVFLFLSENTMFKIYKITILPVKIGLLHCGNIKSEGFREQDFAEVTEPEIVEITGGWRKLQKYQFFLFILLILILIWLGKKAI